jgi:hypothetical protein
LILQEIRRQPDGAFSRLETQTNFTDVETRNPLDNRSTP